MVFPKLSFHVKYCVLACSLCEYLSYFHSSRCKIDRSINRVGKSPPQQKSKPDTTRPCLVTFVGRGASVELFFKLLKEVLARVKKSHHFISRVSNSISTHREELLTLSSIQKKRGLNAFFSPKIPSLPSPSKQT